MNNNRNCTSGLGTTTPSSLKRLSGDFQQMRPKNSSFKYNHSAGIVRNEKPFQCHHYSFYKALWLLVTEWNYTPSLATANGSDALMDESTTKAGEIHRYTDFSWTRVYGCALDTPAKKNIPSFPLLSAPKTILVTGYMRTSTTSKPNSSRHGPSEPSIKTKHPWLNVCTRNTPTTIVLLLLFCFP